MIVDKFLKKLATRSNLMKLISGSILIALVIALGMVGILKLFDFSIDPVVPAVLGAVGGAIYAAVKRK
ncbi:MAG: hypothetical protein ACYS9C_06785 [Planctomycetota bacterium]|jgi:hypothetical protein